MCIQDSCVDGVVLMNDLDYFIKWFADNECIITPSWWFEFELLISKSLLLVEEVTKNQLLVYYHFF